MQACNKAQPEVVVPVPLVCGLVTMMQKVIIYVP